MDNQFEIYKINIKKGKIRYINKSSISHILKDDKIKVKEDYQDEDYNECEYKHIFVQTICVIIIILFLPLVMIKILIIVIKLKYLI